MSDALSPYDESLPDLVRQALARTPARLFTGRAGTAYTTRTALQLRADHAAARDAVYQEVDLARDFGTECIDRLGLFGTSTRANSRTEYLMRPDLGRVFDASSEKRILQECPAQTELQIVLGDGLSAIAVSHHGAYLLTQLWEKAAGQSWQLGRPFFIQFCRVGILNEIGRLLQPQVVILLIGERPGLAQSDSLSAYLAYQPQPSHSDAQRNVISNIHSRGLHPAEAAVRILRLASSLKQNKGSGVTIKETMQENLHLPLK